MDLDFILNLDKVRCTGDVARAGWVFDQDEIREAVDMLNISLPVRIKFMTGCYTLGTHRNYSDHHLITVDQNKSLRSANRTLWHELVHCKQSEDWSREYNQRIELWHDLGYKAARGRHGETYHGNDYEKEARELSTQYEHITLLAYASI